MEVTKGEKLTKEGKGIENKRKKTNIFLRRFEADSAKLSRFLNNFNLNSKNSRKKKRIKIMLDFPAFKASIRLDSPSRSSPAVALQRVDPKPFRNGTEKKME